MTLKENIIPILISLVTGIITFILVFMLTLYLACLISPAVFIDNETGKEFQVMPIGQTIIALFFATVASVITIVFMLKYLYKYNRQKMSKRRIK